MVKSFLVATLAVTGLGVSSQSVLACRRARCCQPQPACCCAANGSSTVPSAPATAPAPPTEAPAPTTTEPAPGPATTQAPGYQSFSYEPGAQPVATPVLQPVSSGRVFYNHVRADRKFLGNY